MVENQMRWLWQSPRGEAMPIGCVYEFSYGKARFDEADLPDGFRVVYHPHGHPDIAAFPTGDMPPVEVDGKTLVLAFLQDAEGVLVATWDEGRWWTPAESRAWLLMLAVPDTYVVAETLAEQQLPRWMRRRRKKGR